MTTTEQMTTALLTEHFRYTPLTLLDDIINTVNELVFRAVNAIETGLNDASPESLGFQLSPQQKKSLDDEAQLQTLAQLKQAEVDGGIVQLETLLNATVDKDFDKFEIYALRNILAVGHEEDADLARWVQLDHYRNIGSADSTVTPEELQLQRRKAHETAKLNAMLKEEEVRNAAVIEQLHSLLGDEGPTTQRPESSLAFLMPPKDSSAQALSQDMQNAVAQLPMILQYLAQLRTSLASPPDSRDARGEGDQFQARRTAYLDSRSRKALQRRGVSEDAVGQNIAPNGRRIARKELEGIEAVAQSLGGAEG